MEHSLGNDEYFYKRNKTKIKTDDIPTSNNSSIGTNHGPLGDSNEFKQIRLRWQPKQ